MLEQHENALLVRLQKNWHIICVLATLQDANFNIAIIRVGINKLLNNSNKSNQNIFGKNYFQQCKCFGVANIYVSGLITSTKSDREIIDGVNCSIRMLYERNNLLFIKIAAFRLVL